ncbi:MULTISPECIES: hypothetical protein [Cyanophyceae]|uniref:hypothetical protein n=1 Tax=Cyanophyceae TaxID=3028117 RepID=UPI00232C183B|nr:MULTISPECIES: hypothetical protein [Cyanophyceae]MDB9356406.1 hypothetical protein [Nodularia spumigena CS-587/03]MDB9316460.1 hypothetical protein [Nodularia spumigena CS-590/01A]MDB9322882.1 hypothetical protein [Nodularia spumigena CS-591/07A]MDB9326322.1 hypothetical protein [Nodularia spumigena CS-590/02]MDB9330647.1 hypothetical protein [Nodularia spumigena CS-591/04]
MKDNISLIAAATGGFMLSVALSGLLRGTPMTAWQLPLSFHSAMVTSSPVAVKKTDKANFLENKTQKS